MRHLLPLAWAALTFAVLAATAPAQGIGRDESVYLVAGESYAAFWGGLLRSPRAALATRDRAFAVNHEHPPLAKELYGATHALFTERLGWTSHLQGARLGACAFGALLSALLASIGLELAGLAGGLLAPALFWAVPRHFYHGHPAALDLPITALWLAVVLAYRRSLSPAPTRAAKFGRAAIAGLAFGAAVATKHNAWFLPPLLLAHWALSRALARRRGEPFGPLPLAFPAMAILGPAVLLASWPWLWRDGWARLGAYLAFHLQHENYSWLYLGRILREPPFPVAYPFVVTALTVPAAVLLVYCGGFLHALGRLVAERRTRAASDELLWLLQAAFSIALIAWPTVPIFGGVKHWLPSMPFLALLGARALAAAGRALWPARAGAVTAALGLAALAPGAWAVAHLHPYGTAAYNELAGGAPGAATLGMQRQYWGDAPVGLLAAIDAHAAPGARIWWQETTALAVRAYQRDGRLRADLRWASGPEEADLSLWQFHQEFRDKEYRTWTAFGDARPVEVLALDEVPLATVYARPGAWR
ncbi:glycosyltransferase family 39 protein [Anaeromyxobacter diazotrophicus]|uniref:Glycosyltransferase RgtA/B/C/D-like domain-containing protein n=1 Tax=Anaeromyxobacter diazotrophicus TaxID=2590199 RepID=A0A7I9VRF6_9BACT|nr:glycosyltransferase family 39 protein [Anaeromyxobacter diazotrophicus]GEJ58828.1 hypothetical protein AMYX_35690 [Anaeromyxobacter diazotrophicus]